MDFVVAKLRRSRYDSSMSTLEAPPRIKVRKTVTLDDDLVQTFAADDPDSLSAAINKILRDEQQRRARAASIRQLAADLEAELGPPDPDEVAKAIVLLSS